MDVFKEIIPLKDWFKTADKPLIIAEPGSAETEDQPFIIAGPCSAETEEQVLKTANALKKERKTHVFRAGIWKPRTRPGDFEGVGAEGLDWLVRVQKEIGLPVGTEVANCAHVEACLKAGIDLLWIGARTTVSPFAVQEIANALKGTDIPVLVKNPVNPDLALWKGALERLYKAGIRKLGAIHRGFSTHDTSKFRNEPMWELATSLRTHHPEIPIICDPSHICGNRALIPYICQKALDLDLQGLMIESHINPGLALTDAAQQVTPTSLTGILAGLKVPSKLAAGADFDENLSTLRHQIDALDEFLLQKISERFEIACKIGKYKRENKVTVLQIDRWKEVLTKRKASAKALGLNPCFIEKILELIHSESIRLQTDELEISHIKNKDKCAD